MSDTNFNIGATIKINTNRASSSFTHTAVIKFNGSTVRTQKNIGASYSWNTTELYKYITKANKATGTVTLTTYSGSTEIGTSSVSFTANVTNSNPTFSNYTYEDTGNVSTQLTGNNQILINGYNVLKVTISTANKAVAKNSATMSKYRLVCGNKSVEKAYSSTADVTLSLSYVTDRTFVVYAIDSRGNSTAITKSAEEWKDYSAIAIKSGSVVRTGGVQKETTLMFEGEFWRTEEALDFGAVANEITACQYKYKKSNESEYGEPINITPTISENKFSFNGTIKGDAGAEGFDLSYSYNIQITVSDKIKTATYNILLGTGSPAMSIHRDGVGFGAPYDEDEGGALQLLGKDITKQKILWNDYLYMQGNHTITLSEKVSEQKNGIILVFSGYSNGSPGNWNWSSYFISKKEVELTEGAGHIFFGGGTQGLASFKYIYIYNDRLEGNNCNILQNDTYDNKGSVLRYVIGV